MKAVMTGGMGNAGAAGIIIRTGPRMAAVSESALMKYESRTDLQDAGRMD